MAANARSWVHAICTGEQAVLAESATRLKVDMHRTRRLAQVSRRRKESICSFFSIRRLCLSRSSEYHWPFFVARVSCKWRRRRGVDHTVDLEKRMQEAGGKKDGQGSWSA
jgi:hypothetical protein